MTEPLDDPDDEGLLTMYRHSFMWPDERLLALRNALLLDWSNGADPAFCLRRVGLVERVLAERGVTFPTAS